MKYGFPVNSTIQAVHRDRLIRNNADKTSKSESTYSLESVDFNISSRMAKIVFDCTTRYRTVERYVTQNYQRYPVYSDWKTKSKAISRSIKLTNDALENLNEHGDPLIREFSGEIVKSLKNEDLIPSWLMRKRIKAEYAGIISSIDNEKNELDSTEKELIQYYDSYNNGYNGTVGNN